MLKRYYQDKYCTIFHGDCREIIPQLKTIDMVVTSPPYNLKKKWWTPGTNGMHKAQSKKFAGDDWYPDDVPEKEYQSDQRAVLELLLSITRGVVCYNHKVRYAFKREGRAFHPMEWINGLPLWVELIWNKKAGMALNCGRPVVCEERIYVLGEPYVYNGRASDLSVLDITAPAQNNGHPCPFPLKLPTRLIHWFTEFEDTVLDPYMGVGTTLRAAKDLCRQAIGIEIDERYCEIAANALRQESLPLQT